MLLIKLGSVEPIETRHLVIHFHLEDETIEVAEDHDMNSGRYKAPLFLKRCKIPKVLSNEIINLLFIMLLYLYQIFHLLSTTKLYSFFRNRMLNH